MALVRWNPNRQPVVSRQNVDDDIECFLEDFFGSPSPWYGGRWTTPRQATFTPRVNLLNHDEEIVLKAELPGIDKEELDISIANDTVTIKGERKAEELTENDCYVCQESTYGSFERSIPLPEKVVSDKVTASLKNGVLTLTLPKAEPSGSVKIQVN